MSLARVALILLITFHLIIQPIGGGPYRKSLNINFKYVAHVGHFKAPVRSFLAGHKTM